MEDNILRLWKILVVTTIVFAGIVFNEEIKPVFIAPFKSLSITTGKIGNSERNVLARDSRNNYKTEIYYGKPGFFSLDEMLKVQNIMVYPEDIVNVFPDPLFGLGSQITITRAMPVVVFDGNVQSICRTFKTTVGELLEEKGIVLGKQDRIEPALTTLLSENLEIKIIRVEETEFIEKVYLDFTTMKKEDPNLAWGKTNVIQKGEKGLKEKVYRIKRENGVEISRVLLEERLIKEPKEQIVVYGTKITYDKIGVASYMNGYTGLRAAYNGVSNGTKLLVVNLSNGKSVIVTRFSSGPFVSGRVIDLTREAFNLIRGTKDSGLIPNVGVAILN